MTGWKDIVEHLADLGHMIENHWPVLAGVAGALWAAGIRLKRRMFANYATNDSVYSQITACRDAIKKDIGLSYEVNTHEHNEIRREFTQELRSFRRDMILLVGDANHRVRLLRELEDDDKE